MFDWDINSVFLLVFFIGFFFALLSLVLSSIGGDFGHGHVDVGGHHGGDILGHGDVVSGEQTSGASVHFSPFSPQVIAAFATGFGGGGYIVSRSTELPPIACLGIAMGSGFFVAFLVFVLISKLFIKAQASSEPRTNELIGTTAEVTIGIPKNGTGEVGYTTMGTRYTAPAVAISGEEIPSRTLVLIQRITAGLFHVEPLRNGVRK